MAAKSPEGKKPEDYTPEELRDEHQQVKIAKSSNSNKRFHIPDEETDNTLCQMAGGYSKTGMKRKDIDKYPPGYFEWCEVCIEVKAGERNPRERIMENLDMLKWGKPPGSERDHLFLEGESLCNKYSGTATRDFAEDDTFEPGKHCVNCARKAGLLGYEDPYQQGGADE